MISIRRSTRPDRRRRPALKSASSCTIQAEASGQFVSCRPGGENFCDGQFFDLTEKLQHVSAVETVHCLPLQRYRHGLELISRRLCCKHSPWTLQECSRQKQHGDT